mmetsp:Transcript_89913/g.253585  ORF Transcript_89913/g.253585 Transcript_89913/m.253585 type:complete len:228 (-) Transcript_89913:548-1231(-)
MNRVSRYTFANFWYFGQKALHGRHHVKASLTTASAPLAIIAPSSASPCTVVTRVSSASGLNSGSDKSTGNTPVSPRPGRECDATYVSTSRRSRCVRAKPKKSARSIPSWPTSASSTILSNSSDDMTRPRPAKSCPSSAREITPEPEESTPLKARSYSSRRPFKRSPSHASRLNSRMPMPSSFAYCAKTFSTYDSGSQCFVMQNVSVHSRRFLKPARRIFALSPSPSV